MFDEVEIQWRDWFGCLRGDDAGARGVEATAATAGRGGGGTGGVGVGSRVVAEGGFGFGRGR